MLNPMLRLSGFPLNHYFNPQSIFPPVPNVSNVASLSALPSVGPHNTAPHDLDPKFGLSSEGPENQEELKQSEALQSPCIVQNRVTSSPKTSSSPSTSSPSPQMPSTNHIPESRIPKKEPQPSVQLLEDRSEDFISPRKRNREMSPILDPLEPLEKISRLEHLTSSIGRSTIKSTIPAASSSNVPTMKSEVISVPSSSSSPLLIKNPITESKVQADQSEIRKNTIDQSEESVEIEKSVQVPENVQTKENSESSTSEDFSSSEENLEDKNENIKVFKNGVEMTTWHCDVCKCIFLDQVSKIAL